METRLLKLRKRMFLSIKEKFFLFLKKRNKNVFVSKKVERYLDNLLMDRFPDELLVEYKKIIQEVDGSYQTPLTEINFLSFLIKLSKAKKILEIGTFKGFSALCFCLAAGKDGQVFSCEKDFSNQKSALQM